MFVYLAGPITGESYENVVNWREYAIDQLRLSGITGLSPMRGKAYLSDEREIANDYSDAMSTTKGITTRDRFDCMRADVVLFNFIGVERISIGIVIGME